MPFAFFTVSDGAQVEEEESPGTGTGSDTREGRGSVFFFQKIRRDAFCHACLSLLLVMPACRPWLSL
jgi:hypothetical protein